MPVPKFMQPVLAASRYLFSVPLPVQILGASDTHVFCNEQGKEILFNDGYEACARLVERFMKFLNKGVVWADRGLRSTTHHFDPERGAGVFPRANAAVKCEQYFKKALCFWQQGKLPRAFFMLGAAVHLVQDACVPHHACCQLFDGHLDYERWVKARKERYRVSEGGIYHLGNTPAEWVVANARVAREYYALVNSQAGKEGYHRATEVLLPRAQRSTAGFLLFFCRLAGA